MRTVLACLVASIAVPVVAAGQQAPARTLVAVFAHPDDESAASPLLARYARDGVKVHLIIATDGAAGGQQTSIPRGPQLARARAEEARCATDALGAAPPIRSDSRTVSSVTMPRIRCACSASRSGCTRNCSGFVPTP